MARRDRVKSLEETLEEFNVRGNLDKLVSSGCDRQQLLFALSMVKTPWQRDSWPGTAGMSLKKLRTVIGRMRALASDIERLNSTGIIALPRLLGSNASDEFYQLPKILQRCASILDARTSVLGPKRRPALNGNIAYLVAVVERDTSRPHDREVGDLLGALLGSQWNPESLKTWRASHCALIGSARRAVRDDQEATQPLAAIPPLPER